MWADKPLLDSSSSSGGYTGPFYTADTSKAAREAFAQFDTNCNNCLDYHEFGKFLKSCDVPESLQATEFAKADLDSIYIEG